MTVHYQDSHVVLHHGDCLDVLRELPDNSVDAVVTDPPYGLEFMGKEWDSFASQSSTSRVQRGAAGGFGDAQGMPWNKARSGTKAVRSTFKCLACGGWSGTFSDARRARQRPCECEEPRYDYAGAPATMLAFQSWCELWAAECLRVLKPGGHMVAFGGSRTWHRLAVAVEDAGFEIRDSIAWLYGSGFPKSLDVSKAIDKAAGAEREVVGTYTARGFSGTSPTSDGRNQWAAGEVTDKAGTRTVPATDAARTWQGWGTALKPAFEPIVVGRKPLTGTVAANVQAHGTGALNIGACRIEHASAADRAESESKNRHADFGSGPRENRVYGKDDRDRGAGGNYDATAGRWPTNVVLDDTQAAELDRQSGVSASKRAERGAGKGVTATYGAWGTTDDTTRGHDDSGGASRFFPTFPTFRYEAKAPTSERPRHGEVAHPTVKPLDLMRWLVRLVTPPGGTVLEPFAGSGTTAEACVLEGFQCIAIEREADYLPLIVSRLAKPLQPGFDLGDIA